MVAECPISTECKLTKAVDFAEHEAFIGFTTYAEDEVPTDGVVDYGKVRRLLSTTTDQSHWQLGRDWQKLEASERS